jgi:hypothetical protein
MEPEVDVNERILIALQSLPKRWQAALWHAEVLGEPPRRLGPLLGIKPNAASSLLLRARTGLTAAFAETTVEGNAGMTRRENAGHRTRASRATTFGRKPSPERTGTKC